MSAARGVDVSDPRWTLTPPGLLADFLTAGVLSAAFLPALCADAQEKPWPDPAFPFGAVYFRKSSPPEQDWERDHKTAAGLGINIFRHWFMWASIENSPGQYDWRDYDRMVELEGQNHIKVVIAEIISGPQKPNPA